MNRGTAGVLTALAVLSADQASKAWVLSQLDLEAVRSIDLLPFLSLTMVWKHGVTFGLLSGLGGAGAWVLSLAALAVVAFLLRWMRRAESLWVVLAIGAVVGGAVGNVIDRARFGSVVDFLHAHAFGYSWYVFNVADAAIVCGSAALVGGGLLSQRRSDPLETVT